MEEVAATIDVSDAVVMLGAAATVAAGPQQEFKWTRESCLLLLHEYELLKDKFKDRKHKKKDLWLQISMKFKKIYACDLEWDVAYKKFRNLKQTFEQVRVKLHQQALLGQVSNRPKWPYYDKFVQILDDPGETYGFTEQQHLQLEHIQQQQLQEQEQQLRHDQVDQHSQIVEHLPHEDAEHHHLHLHHPQQQQQQQQQQHHHHHHHHHHQTHQHHALDPATVGQVMGGEEFTEALANAFQLGEELEIPSHPPDTPPDEPTKTERNDDEEDDEDDGDGDDDDDHDHDAEVVVGPLAHAVEEYEAEEEVQREMEPPHRKRYRRRTTTSYQQERLEIEREKLHTLREIQRGIECKNDILQGILHVLQAKVWQAHPSNE